MEIRNIVFDIGNVLADYRWHDYLQDKGFSPKMIDRIARASTLSPAWGEYDRGVLTTQEVIETFYAGVEVRREMGRDETFYSIDKARELLGFSPQHSWRDVLADPRAGA